MAPGGEGRVGSSPSRRTDPRCRRPWPSRSRSIGCSSWRPSPSRRRSATSTPSRPTSPPPAAAGAWRWSPTGTSCRSSTSPTRPPSSAPASVVRTPPDTKELDYELEVAAVIGRECADVDAGRLARRGRRLHDHERLVGPRPAAPRDGAWASGPAKGKDFATSLGPVPRHPGGAARRRRGAARGR